MWLVDYLYWRYIKKNSLVSKVIWTFHGRARVINRMFNDYGGGI